MSVVVKLNSKGVEHLLKVTAAPDLAERARRIADAAGAEDHAVDTRVGRTRARASVRTSTVKGMVLEARERRLSRAIEAGR